MKKTLKKEFTKSKNRIVNKSELLILLIIIILEYFLNLQKAFFNNELFLSNQWRNDFLKFLIWNSTLFLILFATFVLYIISYNLSYYFLKIRNFYNHIFKIKNLFLDSIKTIYNFTLYFLYKLFLFKIKARFLINDLVINYKKTKKIYFIKFVYGDKVKK